jgi:hypothetical protein
MMWHIINFIGLSSTDFLSTPTAKGIITIQLQTNFKSFIKGISFPKTHNILSIQPLYLLLDCWLSSLYSQIWKPRCDILYNNSNPGRNRTLNDLHSEYKNSTSQHQHNFMPSYQTSLSPPSSNSLLLSSPLKILHPQ